MLKIKNALNASHGRKKRREEFIVIVQYELNGMTKVTRLYLKQANQPAGRLQAHDVFFRVIKPFKANRLV